MKNTILPILLFLITVSCKKTDVSVDQTTVSPSVVFNVNKQIMLNMINDVRQKGCVCGTTKMPSVVKLQWNDTLAKTAYLHSSDMSAKNYFSHIGLDGKQPWDRLAMQGYKWSGVGENIAKNQSTDSLVMDAWLKSEGHCKNIMDGRFRVFGAGMLNLYWTQVFAW